ncbi:MAG: NINE protein, partial [Rubrivivax sp.]
MRPRSRTLAAWLAVLGGALGAHRFYLHGLRDRLGWLFVPPTLAGLVGAWRLQNLGQDDRFAWVLLPLLGLTIAAAMLAGIVIALTPEERWAVRFGQPPRRAGWGAV